MTQSQNILTMLRRLSDLEKIGRRLEQSSPELPGVTSELAATRERLPTAILKHYDERASRGKLAIAPVNGGVCGECHLSLPIGRAADLRHVDGRLLVCDNCGVIIFQDEDKSERLPAPVVKKRRSL